MEYVVGPVLALLIGMKYELADNLVGIKGQYLLMQHGVFNVAKHVGLGVELTIMPRISAFKAHQSDQLSLF